MTKPLDATSSILNNSLQMLIFIYQKNCKKRIVNLMSAVEKSNLSLTDAGMEFFSEASFQLKTTLVPQLCHTALCS